MADKPKKNKNEFAWRKQRPEHGQRIAWRMHGHALYRDGVYNAARNVIMYGTDANPMETSTQYVMGWLPYL